MSLTLLKFKADPDVLITVGPCSYWNGKYQIKLAARLPNGQKWEDSETWPTFTVLPFSFHCWRLRRTLVRRYRAVLRAVRKP